MHGAIDRFRSFLWGIVIGFLLVHLFCRDASSPRPAEPVVKVETLRVPKPETVAVVKWRDRIVGWHHVKPETVIVSPETALVETLYPEGQTNYEVLYARKTGERLKLIAGKYFWDSSGLTMLTLREYAYTLPDEWVFTGTDTGLVFKGRYKVKVKPFLGAGIHMPTLSPQNWSLRPNLGVNISYKRWRLRAETDGEAVRIGGYYEW